ncbi:MAG: CPBP family intramembrane metalloprotease, partial [Bacteroidia bacterium]|nr:CPBP family intramembrane metalloprotease [Bacteroidia bacterium]
IESYMKQMEESAADLTEAFLGVITVKGLLLNLIMIAIIPAIGEELLFRGIIQRWLGSWLENIHVSIIITAAIFSAVHFQFYGFIPRMVFGILFGYMYYWSGSLWLPIVAHLVNNSTAVLLAYIENTATLPFDQDEIGTGENEMFLLIGSTIVVCVLIFYLYRTMKNSFNREVRSETP